VSYAPTRDSIIPSPLQTLGKRPRAEVVNQQVAADAKARHSILFDHGPFGVTFVVPGSIRGQLIARPHLIAAVHRVPLRLLQSSRLLVYTRLL
jgi:hypothetical protein